MNILKNLGFASLKMFGLMVLASLLNLIPILFLRNADSAPLYLEILLTLSYLALLVWLGKVLFSRYQECRKSQAAMFRFGWKDLGYALLFGVLSRLAASLGFVIQMLLSGSTLTANDAFLQDTGSRMSFQHPFFMMLFLLTMVVVAPFFEELVYRGFGNLLFFKKPVSWLGAFLTSILFVLPHVTTWTEVPPYLLISLVVYAAYARRGNVLDSILVHMLNNLLPAIILFLTVL